MISSKPLDFYTAYSNIFGIKLADTDKLKEQVFNLRYQVYCIEKDFNLSHTNSIETDAYDHNSMHSLLIHKPTNTAIGTVRIVLPNHENLLKSYPLQGLTPHPMLQNPKIVKGMTELSRFAISKQVKEMLPNSTEVVSLVGSNNNRQLQVKVMSYISLGLISAAIKMVIESNNNGAFAIMKPTLLRLLAQMGIIFKPLGEMVEYHGMRQPCYIDKTIFQTTKEHNKDIWTVISDNGRLEKMASTLNFVNS